MYRIFCESYENFIYSFETENARLQIAEPLSLIVDLKQYKKEKEQESEQYKRISDLLSFMKENLEKFPRLKAFLWTLEARNIKPKKYHVATEEELEEQTKLVNSFLKLAYWY